MWVHYQHLIPSLAPLCISFFLYAAYRLIHAYTRTHFPVVHVAHLAIMKTYTVYLHITSWHLHKNLVRQQWDNIDTLLGSLLQCTMHRAFRILQEPRDRKTSLYSVSFFHKHPLNLKRDPPNSKHGRKIRPVYLGVYVLVCRHRFMSLLLSIWLIIDDRQFTLLWSLSNKVDLRSRP